MRIQIKKYPLARNQQGVAAVEFALILPLLVLLFFGCLELSNLLITDSRLRYTTASVSDIITQTPTGQIDEDDLSLALIAAKTIIAPFPVNDGLGIRLGILVTAYRPTSITAAEVIWSRMLSGGATTSSTGSLAGFGLTTLACGSTGLPASLLPKTITSPFNDVLVVTGAYRWQPMFTMIYSGTILLQSINYNMPRYSLRLDPITTGAKSIAPAC